MAPVARPSPPGPHPGPLEALRGLEVEEEVAGEAAAPRPAARSPFQTGGMDITTAGATSTFIGGGVMATEKTIVVMRHGMSTWNSAGRIQGASDEPELTLFGETQALRCRNAISRIPFDSCFSSPLKRARQSADIMWKGQEGPLIPLPELREAHLGYLQGMRNEDAAVKHSEEYRAWRETPASFCIDGRYPVMEVFEQAKKAWKVILSAEGSTHLVVTHKSVLRAMLCTALGLTPQSFRAVDVNNGGVSVFRVNRRGEPMLTALNLTTHMHHDDVYY
ncbi:unnamed protein product [Ostreobium quekettii]|uniref:Uncharacterized protein n=1 Tax=Ostreobium quekettii TaxID=121088 RepID=A0A8S1IXW1_9CHLO|nr:unnamed protein product [Ostreobium quekettii]|eukprot:evm.model.scf_87.3 EVM.evm.TU.scf_87.3   scf_87:26498-31812(-)